MKLTLNGATHDIESLATISDLLASLRLPEKLVLVEQNGEAVQRAKFSTANLAENDVIEIVNVVAGG